MSFKNKILDEINADKEREKRAWINNEKTKEEDIERIVEKLIEEVKRSFEFNKNKPEKEFEINWLGMKVYTGCNFISGELHVSVKPKSSHYNKIDFVWNDLSKQYYSDIIYADEEDAKIIRKKLRKWFRKNGIEIGSFKKGVFGGFTYKLKIYID